MACPYNGLAMTGKLPTMKGDVLILCTSQSFHVYAVGRVTKDGQQGFHRAHNVQYFTNRVAAIAAAKALQVMGHRTFSLNIDTKDWRENSQRDRPMP